MQHSIYFIMIRKILFCCLLMQSVLLNAQWENIEYEVYENETTREEQKSNELLPLVFRDGLALTQINEEFLLIDEVGNKKKTFGTWRVYRLKQSGYISFRTQAYILYNNKGEITDSISFTEIYSAALLNDLTVLRRGDTIGLISITDSIYLPLEYFVEDFESTFNWDGELYFDSDALLCLKHKNKYGIIKPDGSVVLPFEYDYLSYSKYSNHIGVCKDNRCGLMDLNKKILIPLQYDAFIGRYHSIHHTPREIDPFIFLKNEKIVFYSLTENKEIKNVPAGEYEWQTPATMLAKANGKWGRFNARGEILIPFDYDVLKNVGNDYENMTANIYTLCKNDSCGLYCLQRGFVLPMQACQSIYYGYAYGQLFYAIQKNNKWHIYYNNMKILTEQGFSSVYFEKNKIFVLEKHDYGVLQLDGKIVYE